MRISVSPKVASSAATTMCAFATRPVPPASAAPWTAAISGLLSQRIRGEEPLVQIGQLHGGFGRQRFVQIHAGAERFAVAGEQDGADAGIALGASESAAIEFAGTEPAFSALRFSGGSGRGAGRGLSRR